MKQKIINALPAIIFLAILVLGGLIDGGAI